MYIVIDLDNKICFGHFTLTKQIDNQSVSFFYENTQV